MRREPRHWSGAVFVVLLLVAWEAVARLELVRALFFPPATAIFAALWSLTASLDLVREYAATLWRAAAGFSLAACLGIATGVVMGFYRPAFSLLEPLIEMLRPIPTVALIPVAILLLGIDNAMKIFVIAWACFFPVWINTLEAVRAVDKELMDTARTFRFSDPAILAKIVLPFASPGIFTGLRISVAFALILAVISEMIAGETGIGRFIIESEMAFRIPQMYAGVFSLAIVGYGLNRIFLLAEQRILRWHYASARAEIVS